MGSVYLSIIFKQDVVCQTPFALICADRCSLAIDFDVNETGEPLNAFECRLEPELADERELGSERGGEGANKINDDHKL